MELGDHDDLTSPLPPGSFALIVGASPARTAHDAIEASLRRVGLRPASATDSEGDGTCIASPGFRLRLGGKSVLAGPAADAALDGADPNDPTTSLLTASLPATWREAGACWLFLPERDADAAGSGGQAESMREFFKMMGARIPGGWTVADMMRRRSRLALDMMLNGPVRYPRTMRGLEAGEWIGLLPPIVGAGPQTNLVVEFGCDA